MATHDEESKTPRSTPSGEIKAAPVAPRNSAEQKPPLKSSAPFAILWFLVPLLTLIGLAMLGAP